MQLEANREKIAVSEGSFAEFKYRLKEMSARNWRVNMEYRMGKIRLYVSGWTGHFGIGSVSRIWKPGDQWLRRRIRM